LLLSCSPLMSTMNIQQSVLRPAVRSALVGQLIIISFMKLFLQILGCQKSLVSPLLQFY
jgi:hypothetical protein